MDHKPETLPDLPLEQTRPAKKKSNIVLRLLKSLFLFVGILLLAVIVAASGAIFWIRTDSARELVQETLNKELKQPLASQGLALSVTRLTGTLPFDWVAGLELSDTQGLFFRAPEVHFDFDFALIPPKLELNKLLIVDGELLRLPKLPQSEESPPPPSEPLTPEKLANLLRNTVQNVLGLPNWLPEVLLHRTGIANLKLPASLAGFALSLSTELDAGFGWKDKKNVPQAGFAIPTLRLVSQDLSLNGHLRWESGDSDQDWLDGTLDFQLAGSANIGAFLGKSTASETVKFDLALKGPILSPVFSLATHLPSFAHEGQKFSDLSLTLKGEPLNLRGFLALNGKCEPVRLDLALRGAVNNEPVHLDLRSETRLASAENFTDFVAALPKLDLRAMGFAVTGALSAEGFAQGIPRLNGKISANISDWHVADAFLPGQKLKGALSTQVFLSHQGQGQDVALDLAMSDFALTDAKGEGVSLKKVESKAQLKDVLGHGDLKTRLTCEGIAVGPLKSLGLAAEVSGAVRGPIHATLSSSGDIVTSLAASWKEGQVAIERLKLMTEPSLFVSDVAKGPLGISMARPATLTYGEKGLSVDTLDVGIVPSGRLTLRGGLGAAGCDLALMLEKFDLSAWKKLVAALPEGIVEASLAMKGALRAPHGQLRLGVKRLKLAGAPLEPMDLALLGQLVQTKGSALNVRLEVPDTTVRALGGEKLEVRASLPLSFAENGVPQLNVDGPLSGRVVWNGKIAPLWKLAALSDQRLSGLLNCTLDLGGRVGEPAVRGRVSVDKGRFEDPVLGVLLREIFCNLDLDARVKNGAPDGGITINAGLGDGMGGKLRVKGSSKLDASAFDITTTISKLHPLRRPDVRLSLSGDVQVTGSAAAPDVRGALVVDNGAIQLENIETGTASVTTLPITESNKTAKKETGPKGSGTAKKKDGKSSGGGSINITVTSPGRFLVDGYGLNSEWRTDLSIRGPLTEPVIAGDVRAVKGSLDFLNKLFSLEKGIITLGGGNLANPLIDMQLTNTGSEITSRIHVFGTVKKMKLKLSSDPEMPQDDVLAHILFGKNANELGRYEALELAAAVAKMASGLGSGMNNPRKALGLDVMRLKSSGSTGSSSGTGMNNMAVETGKYINESIYVGVEQGMKEGSAAGTIQMELTPRLKLELRSQQNNTSGSLNWKLNY